MQASVFVINGTKSLYGFDDITLCPDGLYSEDGALGNLGVDTPYRREQQQSSAAYTSIHKIKSQLKR